MTSNKRERELARAKYERQQARRQQSAAKRRRNQQIIASVVVAALVLSFGGWVVLDKVMSNDASPTPSTVASPTPVSAQANPTAEPTAESALVCAEPGTPRPDNLTFAAPEGEAAPGSLVLTTNCGDIVIELAADAAPRTVASAAFLAGKGFYDATSCHRLTTEGIYVLQCGDPAGNGTGGPGYTVPDENLPQEGEANYPAGTVAMANSGPGTAGSQFFIVYGDTTLPAGYTVWGRVTSGLDLVQQVAAAGVADGSTDGPPAQPVFIESAQVTAG